jgi:hypothetical protein
LPPTFSRQEKRNNLIEKIGVGEISTKGSHVHETHFDGLRSANENRDRVIPVGLADHSGNWSGWSLGGFLK